MDYSVYLLYSVHLEKIHLLTFSQISVQLVQMAAGFLFVYFICLERCPILLLEIYLHVF